MTAHPGPTPAGHSLLEAVAVMDTLRSPGGCPWDREQTHASLSPYAIEEAYEVAQAVAAGDLADLRDELGDLLLQVLFHARIAAEEEGGFDIDDVAAGLVDKLKRRHPHVFAQVQVADAAEVAANWDAIKAAERAAAGASDGQDSPLSAALDRIPPGMPALQRAREVLRRLERAGAPVAPSELPGAELGDAVVRLHRSGLDPEVELRRWVDEVQRGSLGEKAPRHLPGWQ